MVNKTLAWLFLVSQKKNKFEITSNLLVPFDAELVRKLEKSQSTFS